MSPDEFAAQQATTWKDGLAGWGYGAEQIAALRAATDFTIYTPGSQSGVPINIVGSLQVPATDDAEVVGDEIDGFVSGLLGLVGIEADPLSSREHILLANLIQHSWSPGTSLDLPTLVGHGPAAADPQARRVRARPVLPGRRPHEAGDEAQRPARLAGVRGVGRRPAARHPVAAVRARRHGPLRHRHDGPPVRRGAPVRHVARAVQARHVDAPPERHDRPAGAAVHGRGRRLPAADGQPADEEADHAADEAGPGVRRRRRAVDAEPGRRRLQGDLQRRHVDGRPAADRAGQAAPARRHERGGRRRRRRRRRRHDQRAGQARVRAAPGRQGPARGVHDALGDELPARPDDARPDPAADGQHRRRHAGAGGRAGGARAPRPRRAAPAAALSRPHPLPSPP